MGLKTIEYAAKFEFEGPHTFELKRLGGFFVDTLEVKIDSRQVLLTQVGLLKSLGEHTHSCTIEERPVEILWKWNFRTGDPLYIVLKTDSRLLATYGDQNTLARARLGYDKTTQPPQVITALRLVRDEVEREYSEQVAREEFPLDNSSGSNVLSVEYEFSKSINSTFTITDKEQIEARIKGGILSVIESQISGHLSRTTAHTIGETVTRRQQISFSVKAGDSVLYTVIWKTRVRISACHIAVDGVEWIFPYEAKYGLSFEITSQSFIGERQDA